MLEPLEASSSGFLSTQPTQMVLQPAQNQGEPKQKSHPSRLHIASLRSTPSGFLGATQARHNPATISSAKNCHQESLAGTVPAGPSAATSCLGIETPGTRWDEMGQGALLTQTQQTLLSPSKSCHDQDTAPPSVRLRLRFRRRPRLPGNSIRGHAVLCHA